MIKWPNDIYYQKEAKLGGVVVTTFTLGKETIAVIGEWLLLLYSVLKR